eukprot:GILK01006721.1.p1 GENE.GILK01006721.1~~GILK01006721.1.p1  ORF type:complete len:430 (+),score=75.76 GILK01006721.1:34-1290(+)
MESNLLKRVMDILAPSTKKAKVETEEDIGADAIQSVKLRFVRSPDDLNDFSTQFHPEYVHQVFGDDEKIYGYQDPTIEIAFTADSLKPFVSIGYKREMKNSEFNRTGDAERHDLDEIMDETYPGKYDTEASEFLPKLSEPFHPYGQLVQKYTVNNKQFEIYKTTLADESFHEYNRRMQTFVLWFIEAGSHIEADDPKWEVYTVYERYQENKFACAGFCTVYPFWAYPNGERLRVSQFVIFPPFQRQGHGRKLLRTIYHDAVTRNCIEVTVEQPSESFKTLRDLTDIEYMIESGYFDWCKGADGKFAKRPLTQAQLQAIKLSPDTIKDINSKLKLIKPQIRRAYEILKFFFLNVENETVYREYRLEVKQRLWHLSSGEEKAAEDTEARKAHLQEIYDSVEEEYNEILPKLEKLPWINSQ